MSHDLLDVFNVPHSSLPAKKKPKKKTESKRPVGAIQRELYSLLGDNTPSLQITPTSKFKQRLGSKTKPAAWKWEKFTNGARKDGLQLLHWVKGPRRANYPFEQYDVKLKLPELDEELWNRLQDKKSQQDVPEEQAEVKSDEEKEESEKPSESGKEKPKKPDKKKWKLPEIDPPFDYKETAYLFEMCNRYDLRWPIIHDRYVYSGPPRSIETLQQQFYNVCHAIVDDENEMLRKAGIMDELKNQLLSLLQYDKHKEEERKKYLERLLGRSPAEIAEEELLVIEARRFEQAAQKMLEERESLLGLLDLPSGTGNVNQYLSLAGLGQLYNTLMFGGQKKDRKNGSHNTTAPQVTEKSPSAQLLEDRLSSEEARAYGITIHLERILPGVSLRLSKLLQHRVAVQSRVEGVLNELGISKRPVILNKQIVERFNVLSNAIAKLLEMKKDEDRIEGAKLFEESMS